MPHELPDPTLLELRLEGPSVAGRIRVDALGPLAKGLQTLLRRMLASPERRGGRFGREVELLGTLDLVGFAAGSAVLSFEIAPLADRSELLFDPVLDELRELLTLLERAEIGTPAWSATVAAPVLEGLEFLADALDEGVHSIQLGVRQGAWRGSTRLSSAFREHLRRATAAEPEIAPGEIEGVLWECDWRERTAELHTATGERVELRLAEGLDERATELRRARVRVRGTVQRREGRAVTVEVRSIERATGQLQINDPRSGSTWENLSLAELASRQGVPPVTDFEALLVDWPEQESVEDFVAAMDELRRPSSSC